MNRVKTLFAALAVTAAGTLAIAPVASAATSWDQVVAMAAARGISNVTPATSTPAPGITLNFHGTDSNGNPVYGWVTDSGRFFVSKVDLSNPADDPNA